MWHRILMVAWLIMSHKELGMWSQDLYKSYAFAVCSIMQTLNAGLHWIISINYGREGLNGWFEFKLFTYSTCHPLTLPGRDGICQIPWCCVGFRSSMQLYVLGFNINLGCRAWHLERCIAIQLPSWLVLWKIGKQCFTPRTTPLWQN